MIQTKTRPLLYTGVNLSGGEFGDVKAGQPRLFGKHYIYPGEKQFRYFSARGMNVFRIPFRWESLQPELQKPFSVEEMGHIKEVVQQGTRPGNTIILDPHNYARYYGKTIGGGEITPADFADLWKRLAEEFRRNPRVWFGLMNEPHDMPTQDWVEAANAAIAAIRRTGAKNRILVPGNHWSGAHNWVKSDNAVKMREIRDPANNFIYEVHQYLDSDSSGTHFETVSPTIGSERLKSFTEWCRQNRKKALLGEFATPPDESGRVALTDMLQYMQNNPDVWVGFTWWAAGPWWGKYPFSIESENGKDKPQLAWLQPFLQKVK